jgi:hypothetical protein
MRNVKLAAHLHLMSNEMRGHVVSTLVSYSVNLDFKYRLKFIKAFFFGLEVLVPGRTWLIGCVQV